MSDWTSLALLQLVVLAAVGLWFWITLRKDRPPIPPEPKWPRKGQQICEWLAPCPKCGQQEALVYVHGDMLYQGEDVECAHCGNKGTIEVYGPEEVDVDWDGDK